MNDIFDRGPAAGRVRTGGIEKEAAAATGLGATRSQKLVPGFQDVFCWSF